MNKKKITIWQQKVTILNLFYKIWYENFCENFRFLFNIRPVGRDSNTLTVFHAKEYDPSFKTGGPGYETKLEIWGMWSTPSLLLLQGPFWSRVLLGFHLQVK